MPRNDDLMPDLPVARLDTDDRPVVARERLTDAALNPVVVELATLRGLAR